MASALEFLQGDGSETAKPTAKAFLQGSIDEQNLGPQSAKAFLLGDARANQSTEKPGFLSSVVEGMANLGRADASSMSALGRKGAGMGRIGEDLQATFNRAEEKYNIPAGLLARVANTESRFNTSAVSNKGARGIMQFMPDTAKQYGIDPMDPQQAIDAGGQHMRYLLDRYGSDESKALAAYNWGEGNLDKALKKDGDWRSHLPQETYDYLINTQGAKAAGIPDELRGLPVNPTKVDQVRKLYDAMQADDRAALLARDDVDGRVARAVDAQYQRADNTALGRSPLRAVTSGRLEDRALGYRLQGVEPGTALSLASSDVAANMGPQTLATATGEAKPMDFSSEAVQATRRGVVNLKQIGAGLGAWASDVLNDKGAVDGFMQDYKDLSDEAGRLPASVDNLKDIHGGSDLARWAVNAIYANLPMMLPSLAAGGASGLLARSAAKRAFAGLAAEYGEQKAAQMVASRIATAAAGGAGASSVGMETGSIYGDIQQQTGEGHPGLALAAGVPAGILDVLPDMMILKKALGPAAARQVAGGLVARFGAPVAKQMMAEGVTEGAQEAIERGAAAIASGKPFLTQENRDGIIEAMAQGAVAGGVLGGASETLSGEQGNAEKTHGENNINAVGLAGEPGGTGVVAVGPTGRNGVQPDAQPVGITGRPAVESPARSNEPNEPLDPDSIFGRAGAPLPVVTAQGRTKIDRDKPIKPLGDDETLLSAIAKLGGIDAEEAQAQGVDTPYIKGPEAIRGHGIFKVFTKSGRTFDGMAEALRQYGFQVHGANELLAQVTDAIGAQERGQASDLEKFAAEQDDTDYQMEQARKRHADLSPGFEFTEDEYAPEMDPTGRHIHELTTALNRLEDGAGDAILEREAIAGHDNQHTIETLNREITARDRTGESQGEQGQGTRPIAPAEGRGIQVHRMGTGAEGEDTLAKETETAKRKWRMLGQRKREMLLKLDNQPMELANKLFEDLPDDYRKLLTEAEIDHRPETKAATMPGQVDPETGELFSKGGNHEHINAEIYDNAGKTYSGISEDGAGSGLLRGYSISRKEAEQLEKAGVLDIFRVASKGPETTGLQGWFLKNSANSSYVTRKNLITGERLYKNEDWQTIDRQLQDIKKDRDLVSFQRKPGLGQTALEVNVEKKGEQQPADLYSLGKKSQSQTVASVREALGATAQTLENAGILKIVQHQSELPITANGTVRGLHRSSTGVSYLVADNLPQGYEMGVFLHEVGGHASLEAMLGADLYGQLDREAQRILGEHGPVTDAAVKAIARAVPSSAPYAVQRAERIAYLIEYTTHADEADKAKLSTRVRLLVARAMAAIRAWFWRSEFGRSLREQDIGFELTARDVAALARAAVAELAQGPQHGQLQPAFDLASKSNNKKTRPGNYVGTQFKALGDEDAAPKAQGLVAHIADNLKTMTVADMKKLGGASVKGLRSVGLPLLGRRQIVELYGEEVPEIRDYDKLMQAYGADANELQHRAGKLAERWGKLGEAVSDHLADVMHMATAAGVDPAEDYVKEWTGETALAAYQDAFTEAGKEVKRLQGMIRSMPGGSKAELWEKLREARKKFDKLSKPWSEKTFVKRLLKKETERAYDHKSLSNLFDLLPDAAQAVYRQARDMYSQQWKDVEKALAERIERSNASDEQKSRNIAALRLQFRKALPSIYFPLQRDGDYVIVVKDSENHNEMVLFAESLVNAEILKKELEKRYADTDKRVMQIGKKQEKTVQDMVSGKFVSDMLDLLGTEFGGPSLDALREQVTQMYLEALPDLSWAKHEIHRKNVKGYSRNARRAFASHMMHGAAHLSRIRYVDRLERALDHAQAEVEKHQYDGGGYDAVRAQEVVNEMRKRHAIAMNPPNTPWANIATGAGFLWYMGFSPASAIVNLTQTPMVAFPVLAGKFGFRKSAVALSVSSRDIARIFGTGALIKSGAELRDKLDKILPPSEVASIMQGIEDGHITVTLAHELAGVAQGNEPHPAAAPIMGAASYMFHVAELFNRMATHLAAHRLAVESGQGLKSAYDTAVDLTYQGHFDYASTNRPRAMAGPFARVLLLFKQYAQNMTYVLARNGVEALAASNDFMRGQPIAEKRKQAAKTFAGLMAMHGLMAGAFGLPMASTLLAAASWLWGDDDEPFDAEVAMRNYLAHKLGKTLAEMIVHGAPRGLRHVTGIKDTLGAGDISNRVALDHLWFPDIQEGLEGDKWMEAAAMAALGPVAGMALQWGKAGNLMAQGEWERGLENAVPKSLRDLLKAARYHREGVQDKTGVSILDDTTLAEELTQAAGFSPARVLEAYEARGAIYNQDKRLSRRRSELVNDYSRAVMDGDDHAREAARQAVKDFNQANPPEAIKGMALMSSVHEKRKRIAQAKDGIYLPKNRGGLRDLGAFLDAQ